MNSPLEPWEHKNNVVVIRLYLYYKRYKVKTFILNLSVQMQIWQIYNSFPSFLSDAPSYDINIEKTI